MEKRLSHSAEETMRIAAEFANGVKAGDVICLYGELGAGKTQFVKGFAGAFGVSPEQVSSPTFTIIHEYQGKLPVYHFDCYRLGKPEDALEIGAEEYLYGSGVSIVEWPGRIEEILPGHSIRITIKSLSENVREVTFH